MSGETRKLLRDYGGTIVVAVFAALLIRFFVIEAYRIPSPAMKPTLEPGDTIFVAKWPFGFRLPWSTEPITQGRMPARGEVVVFSPSGEIRRDYIKRVIGLPGDVVSVKQGRVSLNGIPLAEDAATGNPCGHERIPNGLSYPVCRETPMLEDVAGERVPAGSVFLLGDFRSEPAPERSEGARPSPRPKSWGIFPVADLKGVALWIWMSVEPRTSSPSTGWFPRFRFERMFRRVE